jgi:homoserine O-acetyltransferase/O-succinyltransferase
VISVGAQATAEEIALCHVQMRAIRADPKWRGGDYYDAAPGDGPHEGLAIARGMGHISYRTELELAARFGRDHQPGEEPFVGGRYAVESYLDYHGDKLVRRFDANSYLIIGKAMDLHDVARGRGGLEAAMARIRIPNLTMGINSDFLYPPYQQRQMSRMLSRTGLPSNYIEIDSPHGHDAFLIHVDQVGEAIAKFLAQVC